LHYNTHPTSSPEATTHGNASATYHAAGRPPVQPTEAQQRRAGGGGVNDKDAAIIFHDM